MSESTADLGATALLAAYRTGELSPVTATRAALDRIEHCEGSVNAFSRVDADGALAAAEESAARWRAGAPCGPLDGVPISIKDTLAAAGWPTGRGSIVAAAGPADHDCLPVARVREAGAVLLGATTTPEMAWKGLTDSPRTGVTTNPWNPALTAGGSSGGSAVAVRLGMGPLSLGTDAAGSVRIPAAFTGAVAHKPTWGHVPDHPTSPFSSLAQVGAMARTVAETALLHDVIATADPRDPWSVPGPRAATALPGAPDITGVRIAFSPDLGYVRVEPEIAELVAEAVRVFCGLGAVVERDDPGFADPYETIEVLWSVAAATALAPFDAAARECMDPGLVAVAERGARVDVLDHQAASVARLGLGTGMAVFHIDYDLLVTPALPIRAFSAGLEMPEGHDGADWLSWTPFTYPFNLTGQPATTVPCGFTADGLPAAIQIVGPMHADAAVLAAARAFDDAAAHHRIRPALAG